MTKTMVSSKMGDKTVERVEKYAEENDISRSQAVEELTRTALDVEEKEGVSLITDGGNPATQEQTRELQRQLKSSSTMQDYQFAALGIAFIWVVLYLEDFFPVLLGSAIGIVVAAANIAPLAVEWYND
jgi:hypothetical protein